MSKATNFPEGIETAEEYDELQRTGVLPIAAQRRVQALQLERLRAFNKRRAEADPSKDPTNWDKVPGAF